MRLEPEREDKTELNHLNLLGDNGVLVVQYSARLYSNEVEKILDDQELYNLVVDIANKSFQHGRNHKAYEIQRALLL